MEPVFDNELLPLIAAYGDLCKEDPSPERVRRLGVIVVDLLRASGVEAALRGHELPIVAFRHNEQSFLLRLSWTGEAIAAALAAELVHALDADAGDATVILLSISGYDVEWRDPTLDVASPRRLLWDRTHIEAVLCGLVPMSDLLAAGTRIAFFQAAPYVSLTRLLADDRRENQPRMFTPDLMPPPWPVLNEPHVSIPAQLALVGEDGWDSPSGIAALDTERLVVVTDGGLLELDHRRGVTSWMVQPTAR